MKHIPFPKIRQWRDARHEIGRAGLSSVWVNGTVKIHGTNASIVRTEDGLVAQSRNRVLSVDDDNAGFAAFVARPDITEFFMSELVDEVVYGEWCGPGIQKGVAVSNLDSKKFVLFGADAYIAPLPTDVHHIRSVGGYEVHVNLETGDGLDKIERLTEEVGRRCPFAASLGVDGPGEGIVWRVLGLGSEAWFKTKASTFSEIVHEPRPRKLQAATFVAPARVEELMHGRRLEQGLEYLQEFNLPIDRTSTGKFVSWVTNDAKVEDAPEAEELRKCGAYAAKWFLAHVEAQP